MSTNKNSALHSVFQEGMRESRDIAFVWISDSKVEQPLLTHTGLLGDFNQWFGNYLERFFNFQSSGTEDDPLFGCNEFLDKLLKKYSQNFGRYEESGLLDVLCFKDFKELRKLFVSPNGDSVIAKDHNLRDAPLWPDEHLCRWLGRARWLSLPSSLTECHREIERLFGVKDDNQTANHSAIIDNNAIGTQVNLSAHVHDDAPFKGEAGAKPKPASIRACICVFHQLLSKSYALDGDDARRPEMKALAEFISVLASNARSIETLLSQTWIDDRLVGLTRSEYIEAQNLLLRLKVTPDSTFNKALDDAPSRRQKS